MPSLATGEDARVLRVQARRLMERLPEHVLLLDLADAPDFYLSESVEATSEAAAAQTLIRLVARSDRSRGGPTHAMFPS